MLNVRFVPKMVIQKSDNKKGILMKKLLLTLAVSVLVATTGFAQTGKDLPDWQYVGYKIVHHMTLQLEHIDELGKNK